MVCWCLWILWGENIEISLAALDCHFVIIPKGKIYKIENIFVFSKPTSLSHSVIIFVLTFSKGFLYPSVLFLLCFVFRVWFILVRLCGQKSKIYSFTHFGDFIAYWYCEFARSSSPSACLKILLNSILVLGY